MSSPASSSTPQRRLSGFLPLAPTKSNSYPQVQRSQQPKADLTAAALTEAASPAADQDLAKQRRSSSLSSAGTSNGIRFLKLGPVHWGEHQEDHQGDFAIE